MIKKPVKSKTIRVDIDYIKQIHAEVCHEWKEKLVDKFPQLGLSNKGKLFIHDDGDVILITKHPNEGIIVKTSGSFHIGKCANWIMSHFKPYTGPKIDLNKVFNNH